VTAGNSPLAVHLPCLQHDQHRYCQSPLSTWLLRRALGEQPAPAAHIATQIETATGWATRLPGQQRHGMPRVTAQCQPSPCVPAPPNTHTGPALQVCRQGCTQCCSWKGEGGVTAATAGWMCAPVAASTGRVQVYGLPSRDATPPGAPCTLHRLLLTKPAIIRAPCNAAVLRAMGPSSAAKEAGHWL
jgi:hypothetical protein